MVPLKDILFKQQAYWVSELDIDALVPCIRLKLISDPDKNTSECDVLFENALEIEVNYHGEADECKSQYLCTLLDVNDEQKDGKHYYLIVTDTVEVSFHTDATPRIEWLEPDKPYQIWQSERINKGENA